MATQSNWRGGHHGGVPPRHRPGGPVDRRALLGLAVAAAAAPLLGGCGLGTRSSDVTFWYSFPTPQEQTWLQANVVVPFQRATGTTIGFSNESEYQVLETALAAGKGPTILYADPTFVTPYVRAGDFRELDGYATRFGWPDKFLPWA